LAAGSIRPGLHPHLTRRNVRDFYRYSTPEQQRRFERARERASP
jgi:hypothetical protein